MKKQLLLALIFASSILLTSCGHHYLFVEGSFVGTLWDINKDIRLDDNGALLTVTNITKEEFDNYDGVNVVEDVFTKNNPYFLIEFKIKNSNNEFIHYDFINLKYVTSQTSNYYDDNGNIIRASQQPGDNSYNHAYMIHYKVNDEILDFSFRKEKS